MANETNATSSIGNSSSMLNSSLLKDSDKPSAPSPSSLTAEDTDSPGTAPSKSPPPSPSSPSPPSPPSQSPPSQPASSPPSPSVANSPPPSPPPSSPPPPPIPSPSPPNSSPPPSSPPSPKVSSPPPTPSAPPLSPPPSSPPPSPPPPNVNNSPPPSPSQPHSPPPPTPPTATPTPTPTPTLPSPASHVPPTLPPPPPTTGPLPNHPPPQQSPPIPPGSHSKPSASPSKSHVPSTSPPSGDNNNTGEYVGLALAAVFILAFIAVVLFIILKRKNKLGGFYNVQPPRKSQMKGDVHYYVEEPGFGNGPQDGFYSFQPPRAGAVHHLRTPSDPAQQMNAGQMVFSYDKIAEITNEFASENVIGEGGFGCVYKASMPDGRVGAVKLLKAGSGQGEREFRAEVDIISRVHHRHLVSLIGYCISEQQRVLIYEYVPNGNLDQHLHGSGRPVLDWSKRVKIAIGAARGLAYLHEGCNPKIIHRDIKSANILLDDAYEAQVADFGLARLTDDANTHVSTRVMGTFGYMAPEYATSGKLTDRSDVFSFGVVLLELITGRKPVDPTQPVGDESLVEWARPLLLRVIESGDFGELVDPRLERQYVDSEMFTMIEAAAACVRHSAPKRPRMVQVARALDNGDQLYDLSNGVKYGQSTVYDSGQYNEDIMRFRRMVNGSFDDSEFDMYSTDYTSTEVSGPRHAWKPHSSGGDSEIRAFNSQRGISDHMS